MPNSPPAVILAFANDWVDDKRHLRSLLDEHKAIAQSLTPLVDTGSLLPPHPIHNATVNEITEAFRQPRYRNRICIFHFGGHASGTELLFEDNQGTPTTAHASGLAGYLGMQEGLVLVFLNGCSTEPQVRQLRDAGVKAVVATTRAIQDKIAADFARAFYAELTTRTLQQAFDAAKQQIQIHWGDRPEDVTRELGDEEQPYTPTWPWILDCDPAYVQWSLATAYTPGLAGWRRAVVVAGALTLLTAATFALSPDARHTTCQLPGVRSLCMRAGIGNIPTEAEQALWTLALEQTSGDGLREYLRTYPAGVYADQARSRLAGCSTDRVETLGPPKEIRYPLTINPRRLHPFATLDQAQDDARTRGDHDATTTCGPIQRTNRLLSASAEPREWLCEPQSDGFTCGFDGDIVCRVQDRILTNEERCRTDPTH